MIVTAVDQSDANRRNRLGKRDVGDEQRSRGADDGVHRRIDVGIRRQHQGDHLSFVFEAFVKQRPDRTIDHAAVQHFTFGGFAFTFEESAGNFSGGIKIFTVVDREWEEVDAFPGFCRPRRP